MRRPDLSCLSLFTLALAALATRPAAAAEPPAAAEAVSPAAAPAAPAEKPRSGGRTLNGHDFIPAADVRWPFTVTSFDSQLVIGLGQTDATFRVGDQTFSGSFDYAGVGGVLGYEYAFLDYFSVRAILDEIVYSGINGESAVVVGTRVLVGFDGGLTASLPLGDSLRLGILLDVSHTPNLALTIGNGLQNIAENCREGSCSIDTGSVFSTQNQTKVTPAVAASWAPWRPLGLTGNVAYQHASASGVSGDGMLLGAAADFDFGAISSVPIGLQLQFRWTAPFAGTLLQHVGDLGGGIFYTGRKDLSLGVQVLSRRFAVTSDVDVSWKTFLATIGMRYYF